jgi:hypothetical protein
MITVNEIYMASVFEVNYLCLSRPHKKYLNPVSP